MPSKPSRASGWNGRGAVVAIASAAD